MKINYGTFNFFCQVFGTLHELYSQHSLSHKGDYTVVFLLTISHIKVMRIKEVISNLRSC